MAEHHAQENQLSLWLVKQLHVMKLTVPGAHGLHGGHVQQHVEGAHKFGQDSSRRLLRMVEHCAWENLQSPRLAEHLHVAMVEKVSSISLYCI